MKDTSVVGSQVGIDIAISGNSGWGIRCEPAPAIAQITTHPSSGYSLTGTHVFGNLAGQISCPGVLRP